MIKVIGWCFLVGGFIWFSLIPFAGYEPPLHQIVGSAALLIAGAILAK